MDLSKIVQKKIKVSVSAYDNIEREKLLSTAAADVIKEIIDTRVSIPVAEFLTYYLFHRKRLCVEKYRNYDTIAKKINIAIATLNDCIDFNGESIITTQGIDQQLNEVSQHIGEAIGLAVVSRIHGVIHADWSSIKEQRGHNAKPTFDFQISSDGEKHIQVENKGSSVKDNRRKCNAIYVHRHSISDKKQKLREMLKAGKDPFPASIRYGTITALDARQQGCAKCWLMDPTSDALEEKPASFRLLTRLRFMYDWISFVFPRSQLTSAIATRILALENLPDPFELDNVPLKPASRDSFDYEPSVPIISIPWVFPYKSVTTKNQEGGYVYPLTENKMFFVGINAKILHMASKQDFAQILRFRFNVESEIESIRCVVTPNQFERFKLPLTITSKAEKTGGYMSFYLRGQIHRSSSGLAFGLLPLT